MWIFIRHILMPNKNCFVQSPLIISNFPTLFNSDATITGIIKNQLLHGMLMNNLLTKKAIQANKTSRRNTLSFALFAATLFSSSSAFANRPAMEESSEVSHEVNSADVEATSSRPEVLSEDQQAGPSSVEIMMQQQNQQIYQTGDIVQLPAKEMQPGETLQIPLLDSPRRGMSMDKVQLTYGQPVAISETVGKPPITRWTYNDRVVYFEYSTVIHVVAR